MALRQGLNDQRICLQWVHIVHCGYWRLKGVHTDLAALQILPASLAGRKFPEQTSSKAKQVSRCWLSAAYVHSPACSTAAYPLGHGSQETKMQNEGLCSAGGACKGAAGRLPAATSGVSASATTSQVRVL